MADTKLVHNTRVEIIWTVRAGAHPDRMAVPAARTLVETEDTTQHRAHDPGHRLSSGSGATNTSMTGVDASSRRSIAPATPRGSSAPASIRTPSQLPAQRRPPAGRAGRHQGAPADHRRRTSSTPGGCRPSASRRMRSPASSTRPGSRSTPTRPACTAASAPSCAAATTASCRSSSTCARKADFADLAEGPEGRRAEAAPAAPRPPSSQRRPPPRPQRSLTLNDLIRRDHHHGLSHARRRTHHDAHDHKPHGLAALGVRHQPQGHRHAVPGVRLHHVLRRRRDGDADPPRAVQARPAVLRSGVLQLA